jgi:hypothetical protein
MKFCLSRESAPNPWENPVLYPFWLCSAIASNMFPARLKTSYIFITQCNVNELHCQGSILTRGKYFLFPVTSVAYLDLACYPVGTEDPLFPESGDQSMKLSTRLCLMPRFVCGVSSAFPHMYAWHDA